MNGLTNVIHNKDLTALTHKAPQEVVHAIAQASERSGVDFAYLLQQAKAESNFNPTAKAGTSSASGLYQFIERTWLGMVKEHGHEYGLGDLADKIDSRFRVKDAKIKKEILALRNDPVVSAQMAAEFALDNEKTLNKLWGGEVGATELYLAHFLGAGGAASFLNARDENPLSPAADLFPKAARANRGVFYDPKTGKARSIEQVYQFFDKKFQIKDGASDPASFAVARGENPLPGAVRPAAPDQTVNLASNNPAPRGGRVYNFEEFRSLYQNTNIVPPLPELSQLPPVPARPVRNSILDTPKGLKPFHSLMTNPVDLMLLSQSDLNPAPQAQEPAGDKKASDDKFRLNS